MTIRLKINLTFLSFLFCFPGFGQQNNFEYKREISGVTGKWHTIILPDEIFGKLNTDLSDMRIMGVNRKGDSIEIPYILHVSTEQSTSKDVPFILINQSENKDGFYFTFETRDTNLVNEIEPAFKQQNFDWKVKLEGSQNLNNWVTILRDYRVISIENEITKFQFSRIVFPPSRYRYFRMSVKSEQKPVLLTATVTLNKTIEGKINKYDIITQKRHEEKRNKESIIDLDLQSIVPVSSLRIHASDESDYYRPITISYVSDSIKTEQGWRYNYHTLTTGTLNSIEPNEFKFNPALLKKIRIVIQNQDNQPLLIDSLHVSGYQYELIARFNSSGPYSLFYGDKNISAPDYDIQRFTDKIPTELTQLTLGNEQIIREEKDGQPIPFFHNKSWLWLTILLIVGLLGWFSMSMLRKKQ